MIPTHLRRFMTLTPLLRLKMSWTFVRLGLLISLTTFCFLFATRGSQVLGKMVQLNHSIPRYAQLPIVQAYQDPSEHVTIVSWLPSTMATPGYLKLAANRQEYAEHKETLS